MKNEDKNLRNISECSAVSFTPQSNYMSVLIIYLVILKQIEIIVGSIHGESKLNSILGIGIPDLLMNLLSCHGFSKNINYVDIFKCLKRMLEYYFSKGFGILEYNTNNLVKLTNEVKQRFVQKKQIIQTIS